MRQRRVRRQDEGGRDITFPDKSEGGLWVELKRRGYIVTVDCPTRAAMQATVDAMVDLQRKRKK